MAKKKGKLLNTLTLWLVLIGAVNWGLAVFNVNVVELIANAVWITLAPIVYVAVGLSGIYQIYKVLK